MRIIGKIYFFRKAWAFYPSIGYDVSMEKMMLLAHSRLVNIAIGVLLATVWILFALNHIRAFWETGVFAFLVFCFSETLQAFFFLIRKMPKSVSVDPFDWLVGIAGTLIPLFFHPGGAVIWAHGDMLVFIGVVIQILGLMSLNRSFAIVAAKREIKTGGLYRFVRHPMYASYLFLFSGYVLFNASLMNFILFILALTFLFLRLIEEEKHLSADTGYRAYKERVRWRLIPFLF